MTYWIESYQSVPRPYPTVKKNTYSALVSIPKKDESE